MADKVGDLLDSLGVTLEREEGDLVTDAVVITKIVTAEGHVSLSIGASEGISWIDQIGLLVSATDITRRDFGRQDDL